MAARGVKRWGSVSECTSSQVQLGDDSTTSLAHTGAMHGVSGRPERCTSEVGAMVSSVWPDCCRLLCCLPVGSLLEKFQEDPRHRRMSRVELACISLIAWTPEKYRQSPSLETLEYLGSPKRSHANCPSFGTPVTNRWKATYAVQRMKL